MSSLTFSRGEVFHIRREEGTHTLFRGQRVDLIKTHNRDIKHHFDVGKKTTCIQERDVYDHYICLIVKKKKKVRY